MLPIITIIGLSIPGLIAGSVIFETIFAIPGIGQLMWQAVMARDYPMILALTLLIAVLWGLTYLLTDLLYTILDPRIRLIGSRAGG